MMSINTITNLMFLQQIKSPEAQTLLKKKKKCNKFQFPGTINRVGHDLCNVKAKYTMKARL